MVQKNSEKAKSPNKHIEKIKRKKHVWLSGRLHIEGRLNEGPRLLFVVITYCERSELLIWQVHQFELGCINVLRRTDTKFTRNCILIGQCAQFFFLRIESTAVQRCARKSSEFASGSKIVDENKGDMEGSSIVDEPGEG